MKTPRNSYMILSNEREQIVNTPGSFNILIDEINKNNINIEMCEVMTTLPTYLTYFTPNQQIVFRAYYLRRLSIYDIRMQYEFRSLNDVERPLKSATEKYIKFLIADYGTKSK